MNPVGPLRVWLWITLAVGVLAWAAAARIQLIEPAPSPYAETRIPDLPDLSAFAILGLICVGAFCALPAALVLAALRWRRPAVAAALLALAIGLCLLSIAAMLADPGVELSVHRAGWLVAAIPAWWALGVLLATRPEILGMVRLSPGWRTGARGALVLSVACLVAWVFWSGWTSPAAERALAKLHYGQSWREVVVAATPICPMGRAEVMDGVMWLDCPAATLGTTRLVTTSIELRFTADKLVGWSRRPYLELRD